MALRFETNIPQELRLRSIAGELVESQFGGHQYRFSSDAGTFYVSEAVGSILHDRFHKLGIEAGEPIEICKREMVRNGRKSIQWEVTEVGFAPGEQPDGTFAVPAAAPAEASVLERQLAASIAEAQARKAPAKASVSEGWQTVLLSQTNALTDVYAAALAYASERHGNAVKADDIRSLLLSVFINISKSGGSRNAA
jgi:hypothetical protein